MKKFMVHYNVRLKDGKCSDTKKKVVSALTPDEAKQRVEEDEHAGMDGCPIEGIYCECITEISSE